MKKILLMAIVAIGFAACKNADQGDAGKLSDEQKKNALKDSSNFTSIEWLDSTYKDLGQVKEGDVVAVSYRFKNSGNHNLVISDVSAECGCTTPDKPQEPIAPGKEGVIKARFNSENKMGENQKHVYVLANTSPNSTTLAFHVTVTK